MGAAGSSSASFPTAGSSVGMSSRNGGGMIGAFAFASASAPEAGGDRALFVRKAQGAGIAWLSPLPKGAVDVTKDPPHALEHDGIRYERARRLPVRVSRVGTGAPSVGERAIVAECAAGATSRLLVVAGTDATLAWRGSALAEGEYDVLPGEPP